MYQSAIPEHRDGTSSIENNQPEMDALRIRRPDRHGPWADGKASRPRNQAEMGTGQKIWEMSARRN